MNPDNSPKKISACLKADSFPVAVIALLIVVVAAFAAIGMVEDPFSFFYPVEETDLTESTEAELLPYSELTLSGSTTVKPVSDLLAEAFMETHENCIVSVTGGGSGAGISSAGTGIVNIGSASRAVTDEELLKYPDLQTHKIGESAVVVILNGIEGDFTDKNELIKAFSDSDGQVDLVLDEKNGEIHVNKTGTSFQVFQRSDESGTEETFASYLGLGKNLDGYGAEGRLGNDGVLAAVENTSNSIAFVDFGFAERSKKVSIAGIESYKNTEITDKSIKAALAGTAKPFPSENSTLTRSLNYLTKGKPDSLEQAFIDFARSQDSVYIFKECGYFSIREIN
ncbi:TPA: PstS family phosphate ABC transporter substrate-binding protein [Methanosarcina acetivorans]|uniref:Phosphate-binding protein n=2 Tax=Methanosarcina acetivorans TaxID=2214 RepID=Q8TND9_METAC|nr:PstS family phosphate ABC transporter substrate-binding protein [Methanosarcina acetivorans]AAM05739.1 phosphate-binding protein [Methanosarcina acetivorans C2A]HIH93183.1 PstS family phosphate ABC transporter substrate-binding protein [Methanosarcina acetivorans]